MARRSYLLIPGAVVFASIACGGVADPGLFSSSGNPGGAGAANESGSAAIAGSESTPANQGGAAAVGGSTGGAGSPSGGNNTSGGHSAGGAGATGGSAGSGGHTGGSGPVAGSGGSAAGAGGSVAGAAGSSGGAGGSGGSGGPVPTCQQLLSQATKQLEAARSCNVSMDAPQCTGKVKTTCGCEVPVERQDSAETQAYEATLKQINANKCLQLCPAIACIAVTRAQCYASSVYATAGSCMSGYGVMPL